MNWNGTDPNENKSGIQIFSHLDKPTKYEYLTNITDHILKGRFFDTNTDVNYLHHAFTHIPNQHK